MTVPPKGVAVQAEQEAHTAKSQRSVVTLLPGPTSVHFGERRPCWPPLPSGILTVSSFIALVPAVAMVGSH